VKSGKRSVSSGDSGFARALAALSEAGIDFVVVGVGHMIGPRGIPALLAAQGFRVERIGRP